MCISSMARSNACIYSRLWPFSAFVWIPFSAFGNANKICLRFLFAFFFFLKVPPGVWESGIFNFIPGPTPSGPGWKGKEAHKVFRLHLTLAYTTPALLKLKWRPFNSIFPIEKRPKKDRFWPCSEGRKTRPEQKSLN